MSTEMFRLFQYFQTIDAEPTPACSLAECSADDRAFYQSFQPTSEPAQKDVVESQRVAKAIRAKFAGCWWNARRAILELDDYALAAYIEGWVVTLDGELFTHGWTVNDGVIIDPTLTVKTLAYFPGLEFSGRTGIGTFSAMPQGRPYKSEPFFMAFGWKGWKSCGYKRAFHRGMTLAMERGGIRVRVETQPQQVLGSTKDGTTQYYKELEMHTEELRTTANAIRDELIATCWVMGISFLEGVQRLEDARTVGDVRACLLEGIGDLKVAQLVDDLSALMGRQEDAWVLLDEQCSAPSAGGELDELGVFNEAARSKPKAQLQPQGGMT